MSSSTSVLSASVHMSIDAQSWAVADQSAKGILSTIRPTVASDCKRHEVIYYLQSLMREHFEVEVLPLGSVPLKTYLPGGDIDLTIVSEENRKEVLARDICTFLQYEGEKNTAFVVNSVEYVPAQVAVVKCIVQDIAVDISFNQIAGYSALHFLEKVDQLIGKDHLFKCSVILIKAWCYYESRTLGAGHGLISTYALDILVLHIVNLFHSSLNGPLSVLHGFLNYYSKFDWDKYCVSLNGPVAISSLPEIVVEPAQNDGSDLLLSEEFLKSHTDIFTVETSDQVFHVKHLNIIDPLKKSNNLGRSVSKANFFRIRTAFSYGAQKLGKALMLPIESIEARLRNFFVNTLNWRQIQDERVPLPEFGAGNPTEVSDLHTLVPGLYNHNHTSPVQSMHPIEDYNRNFSNLLYAPHYPDYNSPRLSNPPTRGYYSHFSNPVYGIDCSSHNLATHSSLPTSSPQVWRKSSGGTRSLDLVPGCRGGTEAGQKTENREISTSSETEERRSCIDLSLDEFPPLPSIKKMHIGEMESGCLLLLEEFPPLPIANQAIAARTPWPDEPNVEPVEIQKSSPSTLENIEAPEALEKNEKMVQAEPYKLEDDKDFPPLSLHEGNLKEGH